MYCSFSVNKESGEVYISPFSENLKRDIKLKKSQQFEYYRGCSFLDLIEDKGFRQWVFDPDEESHLFWDGIRQEHPELSIPISEAREYLLGSKFHFEEGDLSHEELLSKFGDFEASRKERKAAKDRRLLFYRRKLLAACLVLVMALSAWLLIGMRSSMVEYATDFGEWKSITLPDGSMVKLNANSTLRTRKNWKNQEVRKVWLEGEAFFTVTKKNEGTLKFQVITDELTVEVLGTEFNVRNRQGETTVVLEEGSVRLDLQGEEAMMVPGEIVKFKGSTREIVRETTETAPDMTSWKNDVLVMEDTPVSQILQKVEEIYGVEVLIGNEAIKQERLTIGIPMKELDVVVPILEKSLEVKINRESSRLILKSVTQ